MPIVGIELATLQLLFCDLANLATPPLACQLKKGYFCELTLQSTLHAQYHHQSNFNLTACLFFKIF